MAKPWSGHTRQGFRRRVAGRASGAAAPGAGPAGEPNGMGRPAAAGDSPYANIPDGATRSLSRAGHVKPGPNPGGPPSKPEYSHVTDSAPVP